MRDVTGTEPQDVAAPGVPKCASCANCAGILPLTCGLLHDALGAPARCAEERADTGRCGVSGVYWRAAVPGQTAQIILFPGERRLPLPRAGTFDGGSAA